MVLKIMSTADIDTYTIPVKDDPPIGPPTVNTVTIFQRADRNIMLHKHSNYVSIASKRDATPIESVYIETEFVASLLPTYCPFSDSLIAVKHGVVYRFPSFQGRCDPLVPRTFRLEDRTQA